MNDHKTPSQFQRGDRVLIEATIRSVTCHDDAPPTYDVRLGNVGDMIPHAASSLFAIAERHITKA